MIMAIIITVSPSLRGRGLKSFYPICKTFHKSVALFTRAWIEIYGTNGVNNDKNVALFTRAWIEMGVLISSNVIVLVALFTRAWIEIVH